MTDDNFHKLALSESFERVAKVAEERQTFNKAMDNLIAQDADLIDVTPKVTEADREVLIRISNSDDETAQRIRRGLIYTWEVGEIARHRLAERAKIVAWLRNLWDDADDEDFKCAAHAIEHGEHLKEKSK